MANTSFFGEIELGGTARTYFVTGTFHGSIVVAKSEGAARKAFHKAWNGESITEMRLAYYAKPTRCDKPIKRGLI